MRLMSASVVTLKNVASWLAPADTLGSMGSVGPALLASHFLRSGYGRGKFGTWCRRRRNMEHRIKELEQRIERLHRALSAKDDESFVHQLLCLIAGYEARVEYLKTTRSRVVEHFLG